MSSKWAGDYGCAATSRMFRAQSEVRSCSIWRIRLVAYGARLESVLGESPRGFESPILRQMQKRSFLGRFRI